MQLSDSERVALQDLCAVHQTDFTEAERRLRDLEETLNRDARVEQIMATVLEIQNETPPWSY